MSRIGIYAGTFNPVHAGHIAFALQAVQGAGLDKLYFVPERRPRGKQAVEHFGHRVAMLRQAIKPHSQFDILELVDTSLSVSHSLPQLQPLGDELVFLFGSDVVPGVADWPHADRLLQSSELVIGLRNKDARADMHKIVEGWLVQPVVTIIESYAPEVSSSKVRAALRTRKSVPGVLKSVERYSDRNWLYISLS